MPSADCTAEFTKNSATGGDVRRRIAVMVATIGCPAADSRLKRKSKIRYVTMIGMAVSRPVTIFR